jgi:protein-disulfide isomerase
MKAIGIRQAFDISVTLAMGVAAVLLIWRTVAMPRAQPPQAQRPPVQDVESERLVTSIADIPVKGSPAAPIVLIEFSDFECPFCKKHADQTFDRIDRELVASGKVRYAFRNLPLEMHKHAMPAALAAECAGVQGKFFEMRQHLFAHQPELAQAVWLRDSSSLGLNESRFEECVRTARGERVREDIAEAARLGAKATPTFLVGLAEAGGVRLLRRVEGAQAFDVFRDVVDQVAAIRLGTR